MLVGVAEYKNSVNEAIYQSTAREPLGRGWVRGHKLPALTSEKDFPGFGKLSGRPEASKKVVMPDDLPEETSEIKALYRKTHGNYDAGEQRSRNYKYPKVVASNPGFRFGYYGKAQADKFNRGIGAKSALTMDGGEEPGSVQKTALVKTSLEAYQRVRSDHLGESRSLLQSASPLPARRAYGIASGSDDMNAASLIWGLYSVEDQMPDVDLGCCTVPGKRNFATDRAFGVPSVRSDLHAPPIDKRSVASTANYGDDTSAFALIFPNKQGSVEDAFQEHRTKGEVKELIMGAGLQLEPDEFEEVFDLALEMQGRGSDLVSMELFKKAFVEWSIA